MESIFREKIINEEARKDTYICRVRENFPEEKLPIWSVREREAAGRDSNLREREEGEGKEEESAISGWHVEGEERVRFYDRQIL